MPKNFIYEVPPICPLSYKDREHRPYSVITSLDGEFAILARKAKMEEKFVERLQKEGKEITKRYDLGGIGLIGKPYNFIEDSWLLQYVQVPGNACDLGLVYPHDFSESSWGENFRDYEERKKLGEREFPINYGPHNVDSFNQASALIALWVNWANLANCVLNPI